MSHRSAPVALLERLSMDESVRDNTSTRLVERPSLSEAMIVSTCNRLEIYSVANSFHAGVEDVVEVLHEISDVDIETLRGYLYVRYADAAAEHMMVVASGLDSMVVGEQQIIGQVRTAYQEASEKGTVGPALHRRSHRGSRPPLRAETLQFKACASCPEPSSATKPCLDQLEECTHAADVRHSDRQAQADARATPRPIAS